MAVQLLLGNRLHLGRRHEPAILFSWQTDATDGAGMDDPVAAGLAGGFHKGDAFAHGSVCRHAVEVQQLERAQT